MIVTPLPWDSAFFEREVGKVTFLEIEDYQPLAELHLDNRFDLIYAFDPACQWNVGTEAHPSYTCRLADSKVMFAWKPTDEKRPDAGPIFAADVSDYFAWQVPEKLRDLALQSGVHSRFRTDPGFGAGYFEKMYTIWIEKSLRRENCRYVLTKTEVDPQGHTTMAGFVTFDIDDQKRWGSIGLIAVDSAFRGAGIGSILMDQVKQLTLYLGLDGFEVATQKENQGACNFYTRNGCYVQSEVDIYHLWKQKPL